MIGQENVSVRRARVAGGTLVLLALLGVGAAAVSASLPGHPREFGGVEAVLNPLFGGEVLGLLVGGAAALLAVGRWRGQARGMVGVGVLALVVGLALGALVPGWFRTDGGGGAASILSGLLLLLGSALALASAALAQGRRAAHALVLGCVAGPATAMLLGLDPGLVAHQAPHPGAATLSGEAAVSARDVWAVGHTGAGTLTQHWDGTRWQIVASPNAPGDWAHDSMLAGAAAVSARDVWAVGRSAFGPLAEHWDGTRWQVVPTAPSGSAGGGLTSIAVVAANDIWAAGDRVAVTANTRWEVAGSASGALVEHWDGTRWQRVPVPAGPGMVTGVAAVSHQNVWAVGQSIGGPLVEHWDGTRWQVVASPDATALEAVAALSAHDIWVAGAIDHLSASPTIQECCRPLVAHQNGRGWTTWPPISDRNPNTSTSLRGVAAVSSRDVWAVGTADLGVGEAGPLTWHWDGRAWQEVPGPRGAGTHDALTGVAAVSTRDVWAVGGHMLVEHWDGHAWHMIAPPLVLPVASLSVLLAMLCGVLLLAGRQWRSMVAPAALACVGAVLPISLLLARGPDDWAGSSTSLRLYGVPVLVLGCAVGGALLMLLRPNQVGQRRTRPATS
ncbi:MAG: hypothetical protein NVSMB65_16760 [Chloroflexota bacterium]